MRIEPTHFIEVFCWKGVTEHNNLLPISVFNKVVGVSNAIPTITLFLIRPKTTQEQEKSIYYPKQ